MKQPCRARLRNQRCLNAITNDETDLLVVDDLSRMSRDLGDTLDLYELSQWRYMEIVSACDGVSSDSSGAEPSEGRWFGELVHGAPERI